MKAIIKWPTEYGWSKDAGVGNREIWGNKGSVDMDDTNTRAQVESARRRFLGGETGYCQKGGQTRSPTARPSRVGSPEGAAAVEGREAITLGAEKGLPAGGVAGWFLLGVLGRSGARSGEPGPALYSQCRGGRRI